MALHDYLVGEIVQDASDGVLSRREALRRLGLLGLGVTGAAALLAACGDDGAEGSGTTTAPTSVAESTATTAAPASTASADASSTSGPSPGVAELVRFEGPAGELQAAVAGADDPRGAVLVVHENRGLTPHFYDVVGRLAGEGYTALCVDLLSRQGGTAALGDEGAAQAGLGQVPLDDLLADLRAGIDELERRAPGASIGAVGFCFGGGMVWALLDAGEARLAAAAPFYGPAPADADFSGAQAAVLAVYAELDDRVNASRDAAAAALEAAGLTHEVKTYAGADHAFFNDTGQRYQAEAATEAYADLLAWFEQHLA
jgi:carboxymethylenebutenolidase